jgi:hypothetical protein
VTANVDAWNALRGAAVVVVWLTVGGGLVLASLWLRSGGSRAVGPEDEELETVARHHARHSPRSDVVTSFSVAQVAGHGLLGVLTAALLTYAATRGTDRSTGYTAVLVAAAVTATPGIIMFRKWACRARPRVADAVAPNSGRVEDHLPRAVVYAHGIAAVATVALVVLLVIVD